MGNPNCCFMIIPGTFFFSSQSPRGTVPQGHLTPRTLPPRTFDPKDIWSQGHLTPRTLHPRTYDPRKLKNIWGHLIGFLLNKMRCTCNFNLIAEQNAMNCAHNLQLGKKQLLKHLYIHLWETFWLYFRLENQNK